MKLTNGLKYWLVIDGQCSEELYTFENNLMIHGARHLKCKIVSNEEDSLKVEVDGKLAEVIPAITPGKYKVNGKTCTIKRSRPYTPDGRIQSVEMEGHSDTAVIVKDADSKQYSVLHMNGKAEVWKRRSHTFPIVACVCSSVILALIIGAAIVSWNKSYKLKGIDWTKRMLRRAGIQPYMKVKE